MPNSNAPAGTDGRSAAERRSFVARWAAHVRSTPDAEWSRQQNELIDAQLESANAAARRGDTDPERFVAIRDRLRSADRIAGSRTEE
jgi:hypothetical protein